LYVVLVVMSLTACTSVTEKQKARLDYQVQTEMYKTAHCEPETDACLMASITYPRFTKGDSLAVLLANRIIKNSILDALGMGEAEGTTDFGITGALAELDKEFVQLKRDFNTYSTGWSIEIDSRELYRSDTMLVLEVNYMVFTGGAHGNHTTRYFNFHRHTGRLVSLPAFAGNLNDFTSRAEFVFRKTYHLPAEATYEEAGFSFLGNTFTLPANYAFLGDSLRLHYNPYEIAPYAAGDFTITVAVE